MGKKLQCLAIGLTWAWPLIVLMLMVGFNYVETREHAQRLAEIQKYLGDQANAIDSLKQEVDRGQAVTGASIDRVISLLSDARKKLDGKR